MISSHHRVPTHVQFHFEVQDTDHRLLQVPPEHTAIWRYFHRRTRPRDPKPPGSVRKLLAQDPTGDIPVQRQQLASRRLAVAIEHRLRKYSTQTIPPRNPRNLSEGTWLVCFSHSRFIVPENGLCNCATAVNCLLPETKWCVTSRFKTRI